MKSMPTTIATVTIVVPRSGWSISRPPVAPSTMSTGHNVAFTSPIRSARRREQIGGEQQQRELR